MSATAADVGAATGLPRDRQLDGGPSFLAHGYRYVSDRCCAVGSERFAMRLFGQQTVCLRGAEGARAFYEHRLTRSGAMPPSAFTLLQDEGSVAVLDGEEHRRRKLSPREWCTGG